MKKRISKIAENALYHFGGGCIYILFCIMYTCDLFEKKSLWTALLFVMYLLAATACFSTILFKKQPDDEMSVYHTRIARSEAFRLVVILSSVACLGAGAVLLVNRQIVATMKFDIITISSFLGGIYSLLQGYYFIKFEKKGC